MTTSGVYTLSVTRDDIIRMALQDVWAYAPDFQQPTAGQMERASASLNAMIKAWQAANVGLWLNKQCTLPLQGSAQNYTLGPSGSPCCLSSNMVETTLAADAAAGAGTITVDSATGIATTYKIGIELDNSTIQWTTVNGAPAGTVITLTAVLTGAASDGNTVFCYATANQLQRPIGIVEARRRDINGNEVPLYVCSRDEYMQLPLKSSTGPPTQVYFDPQMTNAVLYVWPVDTTMSDRILFTGRMPIQTFANITDSPDFPDEWVDALHFNLALRLPQARKLPPDQYAALKELAIVSLNDADQFDREQTSIFFAPNLGPGRF